MHAYRGAVSQFNQEGLRANLFAVVVGELEELERNIALQHTLKIVHLTVHPGNHGVVGECLAVSVGE